MEKIIEKVDNTEVKSDFNVFCFGENSIDMNTYTHWSEGLTMYITKDNVTMKLNSDEIEILVKSLPRTIGGSY
jgi:hypothetical protein